MSSAFGRSRYDRAGVTVIATSNDAMIAKMYSADGFTPRKTSLAIIKGRR